MDNKDTKFNTLFKKIIAESKFNFTQALPVDLDGFSDVWDVQWLKSYIDSLNKDAVDIRQFKFNSYVFLKISSLIDDDVRKNEDGSVSYRFWTRAFLLNEKICGHNVILELVLDESDPRAYVKDKEEFDALCADEEALKKHRCVLTISDEAGTLDIPETDYAEALYNIAQELKKKSVINSYSDATEEVLLNSELRHEILFSKKQFNFDH